jgi:hypothetical protein
VSTRYVRHKPTDGSSWRCSKRPTIFACRMPLYASPCCCLHRPTAGVRPRSGSRERPPWPLDGRITSGRCATCCSSACRRGHNQCRCEAEQAGEGVTGCRELTRGRYVRTGGCEGVTRSDRAAGRPGEPSRLDLFAPVAVSGCACGIYPQCAGTRPTPVEGAYDRLIDSTQTV